MSNKKNLEVKTDVVLGNGEEKPEEVEVKEGFVKKACGWVKANGKKIFKVAGAVVAVGGAYVLGSMFGLPVIEHDTENSEESLDTNDSEE